MIIQITSIIPKYTGIATIVGSKEFIIKKFDITYTLHLESNLQSTVLQGLLTWKSELLPTIEQIEIRIKHDLKNNLD